MHVEIRHVGGGDIDAIAAIRAQTWETDDFWKSRVERYRSGEHSPQNALPPRTIFVAVSESEILGFVAGHRTRRYACDGELQWIDVASDFRRKGIAGQLLRAIAAWLVQ